MATIKLHVGSFKEDGLESCDFRGRGELKASEGDHHRTISEEEFGPDVTTNERIEEVIADGPEWNRLTKSLIGKNMKVPKELRALVGDGIEFRIGVFDF